MTLVPASKQSRALLLCEDPVESHLLRSLLRSLPRELRPEIISVDPAEPELPAAAAHCDFCFMGFDFAGLTPERLLPRITRVAPAIRSFGILSAATRHGDRADLVRALRAGLHQVLLLEDLSVATLGELLAEACAPTVLAESRPALSQDVPTLRTGSWRITLASQRACFSDATLGDLGYAGTETGTGIGDWKSLIHADDIDRLVAEVHRVLDGSAPPHPVSYRVRRRDGAWLPVVSDDINVELDPGGAPLSIGGTFYHALQEAQDAQEPLAIAGDSTSGKAGQATDTDYAELLTGCDTSITIYRRDAYGVFRVNWCNAAAALLEERPGDSMGGLSAAQTAPPCDGFDLPEALQRVHESGISETREVMLLARGEFARWRRYHLHLLRDDEVMAEVTDISEQVGARLARRTQEEMAQYIARSFPLTCLLLDEQGRVMHCISAAGGVLAGQPSELEDRSIAELFGTTAGAECLQQLAHTLNTGRVNNGLYPVESVTGKRWLECHSAPLRGRPGMPQRVLLSVQDVTARIREIAELRNTREQLREALRHIPLPLYIKDLDGRYLTTNPPFEELLGIEETMLLGKTDVEVFPDELAMALHETDRRLIEGGIAFSELRDAGHGVRRAAHHCFYFPLRDADGAFSGTGGIWLASGDLPPTGNLAESATVHDLEQHRAQQYTEIGEATASVISRVEAVLTEAGDYAGVLRQLEQLVETTMQAQALIHQVADKADQQSLQSLIALKPLAEDIVDLERILLPTGACFENELESSLPPAQCDPVVFHQIMLRGIRHARRALDPRGTLGIRLRHSDSGKRSCISCREGFEGNFVELVIKDSASRLDAADIERLTAVAPQHGPSGGALDDLVGIHALVHAQGGHLQIHQHVPAGISLHMFFRAADCAEDGSSPEEPRSTVARFPLGRIWHNKGPV